MKHIHLFFFLVFYLSSYCQVSVGYTALYTKGVEAITKGNFQAAINDFSEAIKANPNEPIAYYSRGNARQELKLFLDAIKDYTWI